jgi:hypothetical protein
MARRGHGLSLTVLLLGGVAAPQETAPNEWDPTWDPASPDKNVGARPLAALLGQHHRPGGSDPALSAATPPSEPIAGFELRPGRSAIDKGTGLLLYGQAARGTVLLESALRTAVRPGVSGAGADTAAAGAAAPVLTHFRALSVLNHCWVPNARLLRRTTRPGSSSAEAEQEVAVFDLVAVADMNGVAAPTEILIDYSATPGFIEGPSSSWECTNPSPRTVSSIRYPYALDANYKAWQPDPSKENAAGLFSRWEASRRLEREPLVHCKSR